MAKPDSSNQKARNAPIKAYFIHHARTLIASLGVLSRNPLSSMMTIAVIAIALALPTGMYASLNNLSQVSVGWDDSADSDDTFADADSKNRTIDQNITNRVDSQNYGTVYTRVNLQVYARGRTESDAYTGDGDIEVEVTSFDLTPQE